jgi:hypothetical protein
MMPEKKPLPADWLEYIANQERAIGRAPVPTKRTQPKVTRHMSRNQRTALSQTRNPVRAIYQPESQYNQTPTLPDGAETTHEVGPGDVHNSATQWRTGNMTIEPSINGKKVEHRPHRTGQTSTGATGDLDELLKEYGIE